MESCLNVGLPVPYEQVMYVLRLRVGGMYAHVNAWMSVHDLGHNFGLVS